MGLFAAVLAAFAASPAAAANQQVEVTDNAFVTPAVAVKPGETVTWSNTSTSDIHNLEFDESPRFSEPPITSPARAPWITRRTFPTAGTYAYHCHEHGGPGRQGMSGVVYVNETGTVPGTPPAASFTVSTSPAGVGRNVTFDSAASTFAPAASTDPENSIVRREWDLDGNGSFETESGSQPTTSRSYPTTGTRTVTLRVTDFQGLTHTTTRQLTVTDAPIASFTAAPSPAQPGETVSFNGSASRDPDGTIAKYEWDLDGDGSYETNTAATPTAARLYPSEGTVAIKLRVTDNLGVTSELIQPLQVGVPTQPTPVPQPSPSPSPVEQPAPTVPPGTSSPVTCASLTGAKRAACVQKTCKSKKGTARSKCIQRSCRFLKGDKRRACMLKSCATLKGAKKKACVKKYRKRKAGRRAGG